MILFVLSCVALFLITVIFLLFIPAKARKYVFTGVGLYVSVCLSVTMDGFAPNFMRRFLGGKGRPSLCFVTIGRGMWK